jgi:predicted amidohydrolase
MNEIVLRKVKVVDPGGPHHDSIVDILIRDGRDRSGNALRIGAERIVLRLRPW